MDIELKGVPETLLITVRARAEETQRKDSLLSDPYAVSILEQLNLPLDKKSRVVASSQLGCVIRTINIDGIVRYFLSQNHDGLIVALGCGLDARYERIGKSCTGWWDIDVPEAIQIRKRFFKEKDNYKMIARSMFDYAWMNEIPKDKPLLIISEGVFMYFAEEELKELFSKIFTTFPQVEMAFDTIAPFLAKRTNLHSEVRKYNAVFKWGLGHANDLQKWDNKIKIINSYYHINYHKRRWPLSMHIIALVPAFKRGNKVVHIGYK